MTGPETAPPQFEEKPIPRWQKVTAVVYVIATAVLIIAFRGRLSADFWPLDAARVSPNILATIIQIAAYTPVVILFWPPVRRRIHQFVSRHTAPLHAHLEAARRQRDRIHEESLAAHAETQRHLKHVIDHHPDIPPLPPA
jgi:hypothetical protein